MPNLFKRFTNLFTSTRLVSDRKEYVAHRARTVATGGKSFDLSKPELCSTIYSCVSLIANNIAKLKLNVYRTTARGREIYHGHTWQNTLSQNPDLRLSTSKWLNFTVTKLLLEGGVFYYRTDYDESLNVKKELKALGTVKAVAQYDSEVFYKFEGIDSWIPSKDLVFFYLFSRDGITPISPISAIKNELDIQQGAEQTISKFYQNNLFTLLYVEADLDNMGVADKKKAKEYFESLETELAGSANAFNGGVLRVPPLYKLKNIPLPDLKFLESSRFTEGRIASIFNVPGFYLNINEGSSSNPKVEQQALNFRNNCLSNITNILLAELNHKLLTPEEIKQGISIDFDYSQLYTLDLESKAVYMDKLFKMGSLSANEVRQAFGYDRIDNEFADLHFIQSQNQAIEKYDLWINNKMLPPSAPTEPDDNNPKE